jgi:Flp pilus assembly protein TadD
MKNLSNHIKKAHSLVGSLPANLRSCSMILQVSCLILCMIASHALATPQHSSERKMLKFNKDQLKIQAKTPRPSYAERSDGLRSRPKATVTYGDIQNSTASTSSIVAPHIVSVPIDVTENATAPETHTSTDIETYSSPTFAPPPQQEAVIDTSIYRMQPLPASAVPTVPAPTTSATLPEPLIPAEPALTVQEAPIIKEVDSPAEVTLFDATEVGTAPSYNAQMPVTMPNADASTPNLSSAELSRESENILENLPTDIFPYKPEDAINGFNIEREDAERGLNSDVAFDSTEPVEAGIKIQQQSIDVNYELEKAYNALLKGNTEIAVHIYNKVLETYPDNRHALFGLATTYHKLGFLDKARPLYGEILKINPYDKEALNNFLALVGEEAPDSAIAYLEQLKRSNDDFSPIYAQLASLYNKQGEVEKAVLNMQQAVALSPSNMVYMYNLAVIYDTNRDYRRAEALYRQIIKAGLGGEEIPVSVEQIQERLTYLASN